MNHIGFWKLLNCLSFPFEFILDCSYYFFNFILGNFLIEFLIQFLFYLLKARINFQTLPLSISNKCQLLLLRSNEVIHIDEWISTLLLVIFSSKCLFQEYFFIFHWDNVIIKPKPYPQISIIYKCIIVTCLGITIMYYYSMQVIGMFLARCELVLNSLIHFNQLIF